MVARSRLASSWLVVGVVAACGASPAWAQSCDAGDGGVDPSEVGSVRDVFPGDAAIDVPIDAPVRIRYVGRAPATPTLCVRRAGSMVCLDGQTEFNGTEIAWRPASGFLDRATSYRASFSDGEGSNETTFTTGLAASGGSLIFGGISTVDAAPLENDPCGSGAVAVTVTFERARTYATTDALPWPEGDLEYVIYETRGPGVGGAIERDRSRQQRSGSASTSTAQRTFRMAPRDASGPACFTMRVLDPLGRTAGDTREVCVNPAAGNYFAGCSAAATGGRAPFAWALGALVVVMAARRRRFLA